jgi:hypothetical protein
MTRNEIAEELSVEPWDVDDWLLKGCPAEKLLSQWIFDLPAVKRWLKRNKVRIKQTAKPSLTEPGSNYGWLGRRCPKCMEKGFFGEKAGMLCTMGELVMGRWYWRRVGYPCGHSMEIMT